MRELFPQVGQSFLSMSDQAKKVIEKQGNFEALELVEHTDEVQCMHCHRYVSFRMSVANVDGWSPMPTLPIEK